MDNTRNETLTSDEIDPRPPNGAAERTGDSPDVRDEEDGDNAESADEADEEDTPAASAPQGLIVR